MVPFPDTTVRVKSPVPPVGLKYKNSLALDPESNPVNVFPVKT